MFVGVDVGTTGLKAVVFGTDGRVRSAAYRSYPRAMPQPGRQELDPDAVWAALCGAVREAAAGSGKAGAIRTLACSTLGEAFVPIDRDGGKLMDAMLGNDRRGTAEFARFAAGYGDREFAAITGHAKSADFSVSKLLWLRDHRPDVFERAWKFLLFGDYLAFRLTGACAIDYSLASRTMLLDVRSRRWSADLTGRAGVDPAKLAEPVAAGSVIGPVRPALCGELGLPAGVLVVAGGHDVPLALLGCGVTGPGRAVDTTGTTECISAVVGRSPLPLESTVEAGLINEPFADAQSYNTMAFAWNGGVVLEWLLGRVRRVEEFDKRRAAVFAEYDAACAPEPRDLFVLPHFSGTGTPYRTMDSAGAVVGLTLDADDRALYQAAIESLCYEMRIKLELLERRGVSARELIAVGGGAGSPVWVQRKADIWERPIRLLECAEAGAMGAAMLGAVAVGEYASLEQAAAGMVREKAVYQPNPARFAAFRARYEIYRDLYDSLLDIHRRCRALADAPD